MNLINPGGLLWFDDDNRRSIQQKIAEAAQRFRERVGYEPTVCQLNPAQASALEASAAQAASRTRRATAHPTPALPESLRLVPSALIQPHCYLLGIAEGEQPRAAVLPYRDDEETRPSSAARRTDSNRRAREAASAIAPQRAATTTRRGATLGRKVHAVQPALITEPEVAKTEKTARSGRGKESKAAPASAASRTVQAPIIAPSAVATQAMSTPKAASRAARTPRTKAPAAAAPVSLLAAAPVPPTGKSPGTPARSKVVKTANTPATAYSKRGIAPGPPAVKPQSLKPKHGSAASKTTSATSAPVPAPRTRKRSA